MNAYERLLLPENLIYAWRKAKKLYRMTDGYVDAGEIGEFELNLEHRLRKIKQCFEKGRYRLGKLRPLPRPKKLEDEKPIDRQYFHVTIDDQVAWIAVANALGPELDQLMPSWSYGNRLYRPAWYEEDEQQKSKLEIGPYRHQSGHLYRKFQHSWPLFRRHVALTAKAMVKGTPPAYDDMEYADQLAAASANRDNLPYLQAAFWERSVYMSADGSLYHASIDLKQFFPSTRSDAVLRGLGMANHTVEESGPMLTILKDMLRFRLDKAQMTHDTLNHVEPPFGGEQVHGIPTGLFVSGFLANVAMLPIDKEVNELIEERRAIAHFRFVDDHTIIAYDFNQLCDWIDEYRRLLDKHNIGAEVNVQKCDPETFGAWMEEHESIALSQKPLSKRMSKRIQVIKDAAIRDTKIDGANPAKLLTKTLGQVSEIAATNPDILDDEDLEERLKLLEWLLLANIPEHEIRPDTRAAFAAGKIAVLAPMLFHEANDLIDATRSLISLNRHAPEAGKATDEEVETHASAVQEKIKQVEQLTAVHSRKKQQHLEHCFGLLLQAFREYPAKAVLFLRLHQYCRLTGYKGLSNIAEWIKEMRNRNYNVWADYYAGLSLQILATNTPFVARTLNAVNALRSDKEAALDHLKDIASIDDVIFFIPQERETWFHTVARRKFGVTLLAVSYQIRKDVDDEKLVENLNKLALKCISIDFKAGSRKWEEETGRRPGVWAHLIECALSTNATPSSVWRQFQSCFSYSNLADRQAARWYPEVLSDKGWNYFLQSKTAIKETDSGWIREAINDKPERIADARTSKRKAFNRAARSYGSLGKNWITLAEWTEFISNECSPFDPRRSEWTALEIIHQIVSPIINKLSVTEKSLDRLHPNNIVINKSWKTKFSAYQKSAGVSWEEWRSHVRNTNQNTSAIKLRDSATSIIDYRYFTVTRNGLRLEEWDCRLISIGRLLLGLLRFNHGSPRIWNLYGNEQIITLPSAQKFMSLAISTPTLLLIESCLSGRSAETRAILQKPELFGWADGVEANDVELDPPLLLGTNELLEAVVNAQKVLEVNQIAVAMNQPRQLIPFRLKDFASGSDNGGDDGDYGE